MERNERARKAAPAAAGQGSNIPVSGKRPPMAMRYEVKSVLRFGIAWTVRLTGVHLPRFPLLWRSFRPSDNTRLPSPIRRKFLICSVFVLGAAVLTSIIATPVFTGDRQKVVGPAFGINADLLESGDLIFRRGQSFASHLVLLADTQSAYSHVGLLYADGSDMLVIHAVPEGSTGDSAAVRMEPLTSFIATQKASAVSVMRLEHTQARHYAKQAAETAYFYARVPLSFDAQFDLESKDQVYCTELVWRAYLEAGIDLVEGVFDRLETPFGAGDYLLPSSLLNSRYLRKISPLTT